MIGWPSYNRPLVKRGEILFLYDHLDGWDYELERMNKNKKKDFLKIQVAVDIRTKEILALELTDEKTHDGRIFKNLDNQVLDSYSSNGESRTVKMKSVLADGVYDSTAKLKYLLEKMIKPSIKVKKNSFISIRNNRVRNKEARLQSKDYLKWKMKRKYGYRWMA